MDESERPKRYILFELQEEKPRGKATVVRCADDGKNVLTAGELELEVYYGDAGIAETLHPISIGQTSDPSRRPYPPMTVVDFTSDPTSQRAPWTAQVKLSDTNPLIHFTTTGNVDGYARLTQRSVEYFKQNLPRIGEFIRMMQKIDTDPELRNLWKQLEDERQELTILLNTMRIDTAESERVVQAVHDKIQRLQGAIKQRTEFLQQQA